MSEPFPPVGGDTLWELRCTRRALADLGADAAEDTPGDLQTVRTSTAYPRAVDDFISKRTERPDAPGDTLRGMGRGDLISLHSAAGGRGVTWHDPDNDVVWLLGFTPEHDYTLFERRAAAGELLPDEYDELLLELEREQLDFETRIRPGLLTLVQQAVTSPREPQRGTVGDILQLEVSAVVVPTDDWLLCDVWLLVHLPLQAVAADVPGWPGTDLLLTLAGLVGSTDLDYTDHVPASGGTWRPLDPRTEMGIVARNVLQHAAT